MDWIDWTAEFWKIRFKDEKKGAEYLKDLCIRSRDRQKPQAIIPKTDRKKPRRRLDPPVPLRQGLRRINDLRQQAVEAIIRRDREQAARGGVMLAPFRALRKRRDGSGYSLTKHYLRDTCGFGGYIHEPNYLLMSLDAECGRALDVWAATKTAASPVPELSPGVALLVGALFRLIQHTPFVTGEAELLLQTAAEKRLAIPGDLVRFAARLTKRPEWGERIRRCDYEGGATEGCYSYFVDCSPAGNARACRRSHAVRLVETRGPRKPYRPRRPRRAPARRKPQA